jgi:hypothetical protein
MLLNHHHQLPSGAHVRLRLPVRADTERLRALVGSDTAERLVRFDPRRRAVICALELEEVVGVGTIELQRDAAPDLVVARDEDVKSLLEQVLVARAQTARHPPARRGLRLRRFPRR